jgi:hypothetical protein
MTVSLSIFAASQGDTTEREGIMNRKPNVEYVTILTRALVMTNVLSNNNHADRRNVIATTQPMHRRITERVGEARTIRTAQMSGAAYAIALNGDQQRSRAVA